LISKPSIFDAFRLISSPPQTLEFANLAPKLDRIHCVLSTAKRFRVSESSFGDAKPTVPVQSSTAQLTTVTPVSMLSISRRRLWEPNAFARHTS
jgi:hypothetical protein